MTDLVAQLVALIEEAPHYFAPQHDFDGKKAEWFNAQRAALSAAKDGGWQGMEQAPRAPVCQDGNNHYSDYILAWWPGAMAPTRCRWWFRDDSDACNFVADGGYAVFPTKWQPLPNPPKGEV